MMSKKVFLIGIDGGTFDIITPLVEKNDLPNIGKLMHEGVHSNLMSTFPPTTIPAWPTTVTGVNPGKLGINSFIKDAHVYDTDWLISTEDIKVKSIWHYLEEAGKKSIIVNIPYLYPPQKINGIMVSYFNTRSIEDRISSYPKEVAKELFDVLDMESLMQSRRDLGYISGSSGKSNMELWFDRLVHMHTIAVEKLKEAALYLMTKYDWDFFMVVFNSTDFLQHRLWSCIDKESPVYDARLAENYGKEISNCYKRVDNAIGEIKKQLDKDTSVIIMSDHGFSPLKKIFYVNQWLKQQNMLHLKGESRYRLSMIKVPVYQILTKLNMLRMATLLPESLKRISVPIIWKKAKSFSELIDWEKTKAYAHSDSININLKEREPLGIVDKSEYQVVFNFLKDELYRLIDDETGEKVVDKIFEKNEIYHGPFVERANDLYFFFSPSVYRVSAQLPDDNNIFRTITKEDRISGVHHSSFHGIFIASGPDIDSAKLSHNPHLMDIAPTILYLLDLPVPEEIDGCVITEMIDKNYIDNNPVKRSTDTIYLDSVSKSDDTFTHQDSQHIKNLLKDLGYFD